jgi:hypothetical protein
MRHCFIGVDPGHDGAMAVLPESGDAPVSLYTWDKSTQRKVAYRLRKWTPAMAKPEKVWTGNMLALAMTHVHIELEAVLGKTGEGWPTVEALFLPGKANKNFISLAEVTGMQLLAVESACLRPARRIKAAMWRSRMMRLPKFVNKKAAHHAERTYGAIKWPMVQGWAVPQHAWAALWLAEYSRMMWRHEQQLKRRKR